MEYFAACTSTLLKRNVNNREKTKIKRFDNCSAKNRLNHSGLKTLLTKTKKKIQKQKPVSEEISRQTDDKLHER